MGAVELETYQPSSNITFRNHISRSFPWLHMYTRRLFVTVLNYIMILNTIIPFFSVDVQEISVDKNTVVCIGL